MIIEKEKNTTKKIKKNKKSVDKHFSKWYNKL